MILSSGRSYVFIHIPKTGGTALALALESRAKADDIMLGDTPKARRRRQRIKDVPTRGRKWKHSTLADIEGLVPDQMLRRLFTFTMVRNPWDRAVSYYHWLKAQNFENPAVHLAQILSFADFTCHPQDHGDIPGRASRFLHAASRWRRAVPALHPAGTFYQRRAAVV